MKTTLYIVRHGESLGNAQGLLLGHTDLDLSELGYRQANATAEFLKDTHFDKIYSSDLLRAFNTAVPHAKLRGMEVIPDVELREIHLGEWEGLHGADIVERWPESFTPEWNKNYGTFTYPGGENNYEVGYRIKAELERISSENEGKTLLIATHAAAIRAFWAIITDVTPEEMGTAVQFPSNASYTVVTYDENSFNAVEYSHDEHLESVGITKIKLE